MVLCQLDRWKKERVLPTAGLRWAIDDLTADPNGHFLLLELIVPAREAVYYDGRGRDHGNRNEGRASSNHCLAIGKYKSRKRRLRPVLFFFFFFSQLLAICLFLTAAAETSRTNHANFPAKYFLPAKLQNYRMSLFAYRLARISDTSSADLRSSCTSFGAGGSCPNLLSHFHA